MPSIWPAKSAFMAASRSGATFCCAKMQVANRTTQRDNLVINDSLFLLTNIERLVEVPENVFDVFESHRDAHHIGLDAGLELLLGVQLLMGGRRRVNHQAARVSDVSQVRKQFQAVDKLLARVVAALET